MPLPCLGNDMAQFYIEESKQGSRGYVVEIQNADSLLIINYFEILISYGSL
jgi:hypothetical protein